MTSSREETLQERLLHGRNAAEAEKERNANWGKKKSLSSVTGAHCKPLHCRALKARLQGAEDAGQWTWVSPRSLAVKKAGKTSRLRRSFFHWKIHGHFSRQWKEKSILCIILY